jgi:hypothetical protein
VVSLANRPTRLAAAAMTDWKSCEEAADIWTTKTTLYAGAWQMELLLTAV